MDLGTCCFKRFFAGLASLALACTLAAGSLAATALPVQISLLREKADKASLAFDGIDTAREATLTRLANGTYMLSLPVKQLQRMGVSGHLAGLTIGDISYDGTLSGDLDAGTALLTIKNLPASVLTGSNSADALAVTCNIEMDADLLGIFSTAARLCIWAAD